MFQLGWEEQFASLANQEPISAGQVIDKNAYSSFVPGDIFLSGASSCTGCAAGSYASAIGTSGFLESFIKPLTSD